MSRIILTLLLLVNMATLKSQLTSELQLTAGKLRLNLNDQLGGWTHNSLPFIEWQLEDGSYVPMMTAGGPWIMGRKPNGEIVGAYLDGENESPEIAEVTSELPGFWQVSREDIATHLNDYRDNEQVDERIASIYAWPGEGNPHFAAYNGFPLPELSVYPNYWDYNVDGIYNPDDGDYPIPTKYVAVNNPSTHYSAIAWSTYTIRFSENHEITIGATYQVHACSESSSNSTDRNFIAVVFDVLNVGLEDIIGMVVGIKANAQIGDSSDDYMGSDSLASIGYVYNSSPQDAIIGDRPPAFGLSMLRGFVDRVYDDEGNQIGVEEEGVFGSVMPLLANTEIPGMQAPMNPQEFYHYLRGYWRDGLPLERGNDGYDESTVRSTYVYSDSPGNPSGWSEVSVANEPGSRSFLVSSQPIDFAPGTYGTIAWLISATDIADNQLAQVDSLTTTATRIKDAVNYDQTDCDNLVNSVNSQSEQQAFNPVLFPNPTDHQIYLTGLDVEKPLDFAVFDITGRLLLRTANVNGTQPIDVNTLLPGTYFVSIIQNEKMATKRFIKK